MTREAYAKIIAEDIAWCEAQPRTLERDHTILVLRQSIAAEYPRPLSDEAARAMFRQLNVDVHGAPLEAELVALIAAVSRGEYSEVKS